MVWPNGVYHTMEDKQVEQAKRRESKRTLVGISASLSSIMERAKAGEPVFSRMSARIMEREEAHRSGACLTECPYCSPEFIGVTLDDIEGYVD